VAKLSLVRQELLKRQRALRRPPGLVADGRDMGTVIFPEASHKVFLTASAAERAERRYKQLKEKGVSVTLDGLLREILARDARDANRAVAPLRPAEDAVCIDTTGLGIEAVVERVLALPGMHGLILRVRQQPTAIPQPVHQPHMASVSSKPAPDPRWVGSIADKACPACVSTEISPT